MSGTTQTLVGMRGNTQILEVTKFYSAKGSEDKDYRYLFGGAIQITVPEGADERVAELKKACFFSRSSYDPESDSMLSKRNDYIERVKKAVSDYESATKTRCKWFSEKWFFQEKEAKFNEFSDAIGNPDYKDVYLRDLSGWTNK